MYKEPRPMREIHEIQEKIYEETKNMSDKELIEYYHKGAEEAKKKYGLSFKKAQYIR
jgi:hypothetical protein